MALPNGTQATIEHAPAIAIRAELEAAIAASGATYETAYEKWVQVLAPIDSLVALTEVPDVARVRLPYPAHEAPLPAKRPAGASVTGRMRRPWGRIPPRGSASPTPPSGSRRLRMTAPE